MQKKLQGAGKRLATGKQGERMDFDDYLKKNNSSRFKPGQNYGLKKTCLNCGAELENDGSYLSRNRFCSEKCKEEYVKG